MNNDYLELECWFLTRNLHCSQNGKWFISDLYIKTWIALLTEILYLKVFHIENVFVTIERETYWQDLLCVCDMTLREIFCYLVILDLNFVSCVRWGKKIIAGKWVGFCSHVLERFGRCLCIFHLFIIIFFPLWVQKYVNAFSVIIYY